MEVTGCFLPHLLHYPTSLHRPTKTTTISKSYSKRSVTLNSTRLENFCGINCKTLGDATSVKKQLKPKLHIFRFFLSNNPFLFTLRLLRLLVVVGFSLLLLHDGLVSGTTAHLTRNRASQGISCSLSTFHPLLYPTGLIRLVNLPIYETRPTYYETCIGILRE